VGEREWIGCCGVRGGHGGHLTTVMSQRPNSDRRGFEERTPRQWTSRKRSARNARPDRRQASSSDPRVALLRVGRNRSITVPSGSLTWP
jgi:hypothetical protein